MLSESIQGHAWGTYVALERRCSVTEHGIAYGAQALW